MEGVRKAGVLVGARKELNFLEGANITLTVVDSSGAGDNEIEVTIASSTGAGIDHGLLTGLADDDHTQYAHLSQAERFTGLNELAPSTDAKLVLRDLDSGGTPGVADAGSSFIEFRDQDNDRQGFFGINATGDFFFAPEVAGGRVLVQTGPLLVQDSTMSSAGNITSTGGRLESQLGSGIAFRFGGSVRLKDLEADAVTSPWDAVQLVSRGASGGWQGAFEVELSHNAGALFRAFSVRANTDGVTAVTDVIGSFGVTQYSEFAEITVPAAATANKMRFFAEDTGGRSKPHYRDDATGDILLTGVIDRATADLDIVNTTVETTLYSFAVPANALGTNGLLRFTVFGDYLNNSGAGETMTLRIKFGGTTLYQDVTGSIAAATARRPFRIVGEIGNKGATNVQFLVAHWELGAAGSATTGIGDIGAGGATGEIGQHVVASAGDAAIDTTLAATLDITIAHSVASLSISMRRKYAVLELI